VLGAELAAGAAAVLGAELAAGAAAVLRADLAAADDADADADAKLPAAPVSETVVDGLFEADATAPMTTSAPNAMSPVSTL
jgi:hypothetical protein